MRHRQVSSNQNFPNRHRLFTSNNPNTKNERLNVELNNPQKQESVKSEKLKKQYQKKNTRTNANLFKFTNSQKRDHSLSKKIFDKLNYQNKINLNSTITKDNTKAHKNTSSKVTTRTTVKNPNNKQQIKQQNRQKSKSFVLKFSKKSSKSKQKRVNTEAKNLTSSRKSSEELELNFKFKQIMNQPIEQSIFANSKLIEQLKSPTIKSFKLELNQMLTNSRANGKVSELKLEGILNFNENRSRVATTQQSPGKYSYSKFYDDQVNMMSVRSKRNSVKFGESS